MEVLEQLLVVTLSGLYTSLWGAFKDSPYEDFKPRTFLRSVYFSWGIWAAYTYLFPGFTFTENLAGITTQYRLDPGFARFNHVQLFFFVMGVERFLAELYKGFFRIEDQRKYFIPSRFTLLGRPVKSEWIRVPLGILLVSLTIASTYWTKTISSLGAFFLVAYLSGLFVSFGGAYKDAPFEGFAPLKFQRSGVVLAVTAPYFWLYGSVPLGFLIFMNGGLERFLVEYYKTYIKRNMSGKFRPDLKIYEHRKATREKFHIAAWVIILLLAIKSVQLALKK
jgi:hypothetical protein